tara:strand:- start:1018 stop:1251 length:234 start_codon:yes stop_codon:yes gene_type:complete
MYLIISRLKFDISDDSYSVEAQDKDFGRIHEKMKALQLLNTTEDKTFHPLFIDLEGNEKIAKEKARDSYEAQISTKY